jgi:hypothetical protein
MAMPNRLPQQNRANAPATPMPPQLIGTQPVQERVKVLDKHLILVVVHLRLQTSVARHITEIRLFIRHLSLHELHRRRLPRLRDAARLHRCSYH